MVRNLRVAVNNFKFRSCQVSFLYVMGDLSGQFRWLLLFSYVYSFNLILKDKLIGENRFRYSC